jgi:hypothetical protein
VNTFKTEETVNKKMVENITITDSAMRRSSKSECDVREDYNRGRKIRNFGIQMHVSGRAH